MDWAKAKRFATGHSLVSSVSSVSLLGKPVVWKKVRIILFSSLLSRRPFRSLLETSGVSLVACRQALHSNGYGACTAAL